MRRLYTLLLIVVHSLLLVYLLDGVVGSNSTGVDQVLKTRCRDGERQALLKFKDNLYDDHDVLSSWNNKEENGECCHWCGIQCDRVSGHVIMLGICQSKYLRGNISSSLIELSHLNYLNLQGMNFSGNPIPSFFGKMTSLTILNLSSCNLQGLIPESFGNLIALEYLDLSHNKLEGEIPKSIWNICTLKFLNVFSNKLGGQFFDEPTERSCGKHSLKNLDVSRNSIMGSFPNLTFFSSLKTLSLSSNQINGSVHQSIGQLSELEYLDISNNSLQGVISAAHFSKLSKLRILDLSFNQLHLNVSSAWIPPFKLEEIRLSSCKLGTQFPEWLRTQTNYVHLDISNTKISDSIPNWFWNLSNNSTFMNVSNNQIRGAITNSTIEWNRYKEEIDLSSNQLEGPVPLFLFKVNVLQLSRNNFSEINSICGVTEDGWLTILDLSYNQLSGKLLNCWSHFKYLKVLNLAYNYELEGEIPTTLGSLTLLEALLLSKNRFVGELPSSLKNCTELEVLDVGENKLWGPIPTWIGERLAKLIVLSLRSNHFNGSIPVNLCHLQHLQLLDLSINHISGSIPKCVGNLSAIRERSNKNTSTTIEYDYINPSTPSAQIGFSYTHAVQVMRKGNVYEYENTLGLLKGIDVSCNKLRGEIPREITELIGLVYLNLSRNNLSGQIPSDIGYLTSLDFLDLSNNHFLGKIPQSVAQIDRLSMLNLSNNNLSGKIPTGNQLQTFGVDTYMGNPGLCGDPLHKKCQEEPISSEPNEGAGDGDDDDDEVIADGFYLSMGVGFAFGFWGICGTLFFNKTWRYAYFKFLNDLKDGIYVMAMVHKTKLLRTTRS